MKKKSSYGQNHDSAYIDIDIYNMCVHIHTNLAQVMVL